jgi:hypothetical protein
MGARCWNRGLSSGSGRGGLLPDSSRDGDCDVSRIDGPADRGRYLCVLQNDQEDRSRINRGDMECPVCKANNPDGNLFCGKCGAAFSAAIQAVDRQVEKLLGEKFKDRGLVEYEVSDNLIKTFRGDFQSFGMGVRFSAFCSCTRIGHSRIAWIQDVYGGNSDNQGCGGGGRK